MKSLLKPDLWKIVLAAILFYASSALWRMYIITRISDTFPRGFPLQYYVGWGPCPPGESCFEFSWLYLILDIVIWYILSAWIVQQVRRKRA